MVQGFRGLGFRFFRDLGAQGFRDLGVQGLGIQGSEMVVMMMVQIRVDEAEAAGNEVDSTGVTDNAD